MQSVVFLAHTWETEEANTWHVESVNAIIICLLQIFNVSQLSVLRVCYIWGQITYLWEVNVFVVLGYQKLYKCRDAYAHSRSGDPSLRVPQHCIIGTCRHVAKSVAHLDSIETTSSSNTLMTYN